ncbi:MAG: lamin tail domain-containing protein, partial [Verrucomicrobiales bacterium]|nr:lamin tail domain-containing protein [Verrucomicrobiales bacterium]
MAARRADIRSQIAPPLTAASSFQNQGGFPTTTLPYTVASGTFDASRATSVTVAGKSASLNFRNHTWTYSPPTETLVTDNATWRYLDDGSDQQTAWRAPEFDDSLWLSGPAPLGYGDDGEATEIANGENTHFTNYFRHTFEVDGTNAYDTVTIRLRRDDGAVIYLNGTEVVRDNLSTVPTRFDTPADENQVGDPESEWYTFQLDPASLVTGTNVLAAEVHQINDTSPDTRFELELTGTEFSSDLLPGINRLAVVEYGNTGTPLSTSHVDIFYDDGDTSTISGTLGADTTLDTASGPWQIPGNLTVPAGVKLTIEPGTTLLFGDSDRLIIEAGGRLVCDGTPDRRIRLTRSIDASFTWDGIEFTDTATENSISYTDMEWGDDQGDSIVVDNSRLVLDHVTWDHCDTTVIEADSPQLLVTDCSFPQISSAEVIHGSVLEGDDFFIVQRSTFVPSSGYNDTIDFSGGARPGPIFTAYDNIFLGATDDCFDLDGTDAHIEGNIFMNVHLDTPRDSTSNAIATDAESKVTVVRNVFYDIDHALLLKNEAEAIFENNTVIGATIAAINLDEPLRSGFVPGRSIAMDSNIFVDVNALFAEEFSSNGEPDPMITGHRNIIPSEKHYIGDGNIDTLPFFLNPGAPPVPKINVALLPGTPGTGAGRNGRDIGAAVQRGVTNNLPGPWSAELPLGTPVELSTLAPATYRVEFIAKDSASYWQSTGAPSESHTWTVDPNSVGGVLLNEIQAAHPTAPDAVELHNTGTSPVDLTGWSLTDSPNNITRFPFPPGTTIPANGYLTFDTTTTGIGLDRDGDSAHLYDNGALVDEVTFGIQIPTHTIARNGTDRSWQLSSPSLGSGNTPAITVPPSAVRINEWLASSEVTFSDDFIELYNLSDFPAAIGGCLLSDDPSTDRRQQLPPLSFIAPNGFLALKAGSTHFPFRLDAFYDWVALIAPDGTTIDLVNVLCSTPDTSEGRLPDGSDTRSTFSFPTFGLTNNRDEGETIITDSPIVPLSQRWAFADAFSETPAEWNTTGFDDTGWRSGPGPIGSDDDQAADFFGTDLTDTYRRPQITYYFRTSFEFSGDPGETDLVVTRYIDDGYVLYLNGVPIDDKNIADIPPA